MLVSKCTYNSGEKKKTFKMMKDGVNAQNHQDSSPKHCNSRIIGAWCQSWLLCSLSLKTSNCRLQLLRAQSPSSHPFHLNHHQFLLPPYLNLRCNSDPSSLVYSPQRQNRLFPSSTIASYKLQGILWLFRGWYFLTKILSIHSVLCHRSCFPHWAFPCTLHWALPEMHI